MDGNFLFRKMIEHPFITHKKWNSLIQFTYSRECVFEKKWDEYTRLARGLIIDLETKEVIALPFKRFFNLNEVEETKLYNLPRMPFTATEKLDGSLAIHFKYKDEYYIATKGSFESEQAMWATEWFRKNVRSSEMNPDYTYLFEIIYPENKIVVDYGNRSELVFLSAINKRTEEELEYDDLILEAQKLNVTLVDRVTGFKTLEDLYDYCKKLPIEKEGFVVTFKNGLKIKIKAEQYCKIHRMLAHMTPLAFWDAWDFEKADIPKSYMAELPEEFRDVTDSLHKQIYDLHHNVMNNIIEAYNKILKVRSNITDNKHFITMVEIMFPKIKSDLLHYHNKKIYKLWWGIHQRVRPTYNILPDSDADFKRLNRILEEN
jgi:RNA ligase